VGLSVLSLALFAGGLAQADIIGPVFLLDVTTPTAHAQLPIEASQEMYDPITQSWHWVLPAAVDIKVGDTLLATLRTAEVTIRQDPQVSLAFSVMAGAANTHFLISSAMVPINPALVNPDAKASVGISVTDNMGDGVTLTGTGGAGANRSYLAHYNGFVPGGAAFAEEIALVSTADPFGTATSSSAVPVAGYQTIAGSVADMSAMLDFTLTPFDMASGTSFYEIVPEPATFGLLVLALVLRRR
jgi:hypothetical protein